MIMPIRLLGTWTLVWKTLLVFLIGLVFLGAINVGDQSGEKVYRVAMHEDITTTSYINYLGPGATVWNAYVLGNMHLSLYKLADVTLRPIPQLAEDYATPIIREGDFWTSEVCIKEGVRWSTGEELAAEDVAFSYNGYSELEGIFMALGVSCPRL